MYTKSGTKMPVIKKWVGKNKINAKKHIKYVNRTHTISYPIHIFLHNKGGRMGMEEGFYFKDFSVMSVDHC